MSPGDYFGEMSLITGAARSATVISKTDTLIYEIKKSSLEPLLEAYPYLPESIAKTVAKRSFVGKNAIAQIEERLAIESEQEVVKNQLLERMLRFFQM